MHRVKRLSAVALVLSLTVAANLGLSFLDRGRHMTEQEMSTRTGGMRNFCALVGGVTVGCALMGNAPCALGGVLVWAVACETGG